MISNACHTYYSYCRNSHTSYPCSSIYCISKHTPDSILYLGKVLPYAIIPMLVVYCLKSVSVLKAPYGIPELIALIVVVCIHKWKHSTLLSILLVTMTYMFLIQTVF